MQHITDGPDIPEEIEHALRNDELVFFCSAGISAQDGGLPIFKTLVKQVCEKFNIDIESEPLLNEAWKRENYDSILDLVEGNEPFSVSRSDLRKEVIDILERRESEDDYNDTNKYEIHKALLNLSALPDKKGYRLVTTNFDRLFFEAGLNPALSDSAPKLAPARKEIWKNLTFLHGVIDKEQDPEGDNLILTRRDFGLAYLSDKWAAQFVLQLFQDFTVLFIGYGANDPLMNYLFSVSKFENQRRSKNEKKIKYAFAKYKKNDEKEQVENKWKSMGIEPIPYKVKNNENHSLLYDIIKKWANWKKTNLTDKKHQLKEIFKSPYRDPNKKKTQNVISLLNREAKLIEYFPKISLTPELLKKNESKNKPVDISWLEPISNSGLLNKLTNKTATSIQWREELSTTEYHITEWLLLTKKRQF